MSSSLFDSGSRGMTEVPMGERGGNGRYKMPLLPGEEGVKSGGDWVPGGLQSVTNMLDGFEESRGLNIWEQEQALIGLAMQPSLYGELSLAVTRWIAEGVDFSQIKDYPEVRRFLTGGADHSATELSIIGRAKQAAGANEARQAGTNLHTAWEYRAKSGQLIGTPYMQAMLLTIEELLERAGLERVPGLSERTVRNVEVRTAGRFDDILSERATGRLLISDLKTKRKPFRSWLAVDGQLATYARSEWMLTQDGQDYEPGPVHAVDLTEGVVLHLPSDGSEPSLRRADLVEGWEVAKLARRVIDRRAYGKSAARLAEDRWIPRTS
ncbi:MAG: hypothetical protein ACRCUC_00255 [Aestuariivirga sp.]